MKKRLLLGAVPAVALTVGLLSANEAGSQSELSWDGLAPFGLNLDGSPAAELISDNSVSIDVVKASNSDVAACLEQIGYDAEVLGDGRFGYQVANYGDDDALDVAVASCEDRHAVPAVELTEPDQWQALYRATVRQADCLRKHGVDVADAPSEKEWIGSQGAAWDPEQFLSPAVASDEAYYELLIACPDPR